MRIPDELGNLVAHARHVMVLTGAGVSAESGVPTFREAQTGLWENFRAEDLATPEAFQAHPKRVWDWYAWRRQIISFAAPNPAHLALAELEQCLPRFVLVTQNVDGLHQQAGSRDVIELHGNIFRAKCSDENRLVTGWSEADDTPPRCPVCEGFLRPDVVWFGESLPEAALLRAMAESLQCDVFLSVGTSGLVYPAAMLPGNALGGGATVVEINPKPALAGRAHHVFPAPAGTVLPNLVAAVKNTLGKSGE